MTIKRYGFYGKDDFGHQYNAFSERDDAHGDWVAFEDYEALADAALYAINQMDLTCMRSSEEISVSEGCPCPICILQRLCCMVSVAQKALPSHACNCGWPRTTDGEHGANCPCSASTSGADHD